jgi:hypothetical protein
MAALVVACRADRDTLGGVPLGRVATDMGRHPGYLERTLKAVDPRYLYVRKSVVYLGEHFKIANISANISANDNSLGIQDKGNPAAPPETPAVGDNAAAAAALADGRATLARAITARTSSRRRR